MAATPSSIVDIATAVLALSKAVWRIGISLSKLHQDTASIDTEIASLAEEVKLLGNECDLVYADLDDMPSKSEAISLPQYGVDNKIWGCLGSQVEESNGTMQDLELLVKSIRAEWGSSDQFQRQKSLEKTRDQVFGFKTEVCRHADNLRTALLLINMTVVHLVPGRVNDSLSNDVKRLQDMIVKLRRSSEAGPQSSLFCTETTLIQNAQEIVVKGTAMLDANLAAGSVTGSQAAANSTIRVADWLGTLESMRQDQQNTVPAEPTGDDSDDDLEIDMAKSALATGMKAFEAQDWEESESLLQEALRVVQQLPKRQRAFCDIFGLHYQLSICAYHTQEPAAAEEALVSVVQQSASSDEQRRCIYDARHLLSCLYVRTDQIDRARYQCEKALQGRRRSLGKDDDVSLESMALMAHIYVLLNNRARAKSCLAMIPEARRDAVLRIVEQSLGRTVEHLDFSSLLTRPMSEESEQTSRSQSRLSSSTLSLTPETNSYGFAPGTSSKSPATSVRQPHHRYLSKDKSFEDLRSILSSTEERSESGATVQDAANEDKPTDLKGLSVATLSLGEVPDANDTSGGRSLSRKDILEKIGCQPRDQVEEAVCKGDHSALAGLLNSKKGFWRSRLRKRVRPERVTALHFAALFGEIDMARRLLGAGYNVNDVPYGYSTSLTCLKFAIGARQVEMVEFLIANGARPAERETWSTLAGQLMNRSWLMKTMSDAEKEFVPNRIIAIMSILLRQGWDINAPFDPSGSTVLHQAVVFWTGAYRWDLNLRAEVTFFLCEQGADTLQANKDGKTPYDLASASGHQDLLLMLERGPNQKLNSSGPAVPVELPSDAYTTMRAEKRSYHGWNGDPRSCQR
ncbi:hypothetical protein BDV96DRAFT_672063 [Lophiotrema nucula]|uniref:Uncharacterized protein n=1 Tax=Lophiotrema nucula TaxID=690887 RepID=A0A6A5ZMT2_9PLEO|nr:hypothetical protein BDV96DRAFT_672063 [Lophiotrema nucula]